MDYAFLITIFLLLTFRALYRTHRRYQLRKQAEDCINEWTREHLRQECYLRTIFRVIDPLEEAVLPRGWEVLTKSGSP